jgi:tetratricopeptide (TPR) repeat protein
MNVKIFIRSSRVLFLISLTIFALSNYTFSQDTVKKSTTPVKEQQPSAPGTPAKLKQPVIIRPGDKQPATKEQNPMKQFSKEELSKSPVQQKSNLDTNEMRADELFKYGSRKGSQGDYQGAVKDLTKSLSYHKDGNTYLKRALAYIMMDNYPSAIEDLNEAITMLPTSAKAYLTRGVCFYELKEFEKSNGDLDKSIELDHKNPLAFNYKAAIKYQEQDFQGAMENYSEIIKIDSNNKQAYTNRGMIRHYLKDYKGAIEDYDKALKLDPYNPTAYNNRGAAKVTLKDYNSALTDFDAALQLKDDYADAYGNRGNVKLNLGNTNGACEDWQKAYSLGMQSVQQMITKYCQ